MATDITKWQRQNYKKTKQVDVSLGATKMVDTTKTKTKFGTGGLLNVLLPAAVGAAATHYMMGRKKKKNEDVNATSSNTTAEDSGEKSANTSGFKIAADKARDKATKKIPTNTNRDNMSSAEKMLMGQGSGAGNKSRAKIPGGASTPTTTSASEPEKKKPTQDDLDKMSFTKAFNEKRVNQGAKTFMWRGNKYTTELKDGQENKDTVVNNDRKNIKKTKTGPINTGENKIKKASAAVQDPRNKILKDLVPNYAKGNISEAVAKKIEKIGNDKTLTQAEQRKKVRALLKSNEVRRQKRKTREQRRKESKSVTQAVLDSAKLTGGVAP